MFNGGVDPEDFGMLPPAMINALEANNDTDTAAVEATKPAFLTALDWVHTLMSSGQALATVRPLTVNSVIEYKPRLVFKGAQHDQPAGRDEQGPVGVPAIPVVRQHFRRAVLCGDDGCDACLGCDEESAGPHAL